MKDLLTHILNQILEDGSFSIEEETGENDFVTLHASVDPSSMGLVIGKKGKTIKAIRNLLRVRATLEKIGFTFEVTEK